MTKLPSNYRLAFRELGLSIGLRASTMLSTFVAKNAAIFREEEDLDDRIRALKTV